MTYTAVSAAIKTLLLTCPSLAVVYDHEPDELEQYPAATITASGQPDNVFRSTSQNLRTIAFTVRLYFPTPNGRDQAAETQIRATLDEVNAVFDTHSTLNGTCDYAEPLTGSILDADREVPTKVAELTIQAKGMVSRIA